MSQPDFKSDDYYKVLGLSRDTTTADITKAYRQLARKEHPDKNPDRKEEAEKNFKVISEAYHNLSDPEKRETYDQFGKQGPVGCGGPGGSSATGMSQAQAEALFRELFGGLGGLGSMGGMGGMGNMGGMGGTQGMRGMGGMGGMGDMSDTGSFIFNLGGPLGSPFPGAAGRGSRMGGGTSNLLRASPAHALPNGAAVVVRGLVKAPEHNGKTGRVLGFNESRRRYDVTLEGDVRLSLRPESLTQQCQVEVVGLESKPELNGKCGDIVGFDEASGRYVVLLQQPPIACSLQCGNCVLKAGTRVVLQGLSKQHFNGLMAQIVDVDGANSRYVVKSESGEQIKVKYDKVVC